MVIKLKEGETVLNIDDVMRYKSSSDYPPFEILFEDGEMIKTNIAPSITNKMGNTRHYNSGMTQQYAAAYK